MNLLHPQSEIRKEEKLIKSVSRNPRTLIFEGARDTKVKETLIRDQYLLSWRHPCSTLPPTNMYDQVDTQSNTYQSSMSGSRKQTNTMEEPT